ncbi:hypothetical protein TNCV_2476741 [Trichonephila clavipes]|nr:hypothetical protein TNCV_2476741 [Trichonephila clavipes]
MMAFLLKQTKEVLLEVAVDLGVEVNSTLTKSEIKNRICQSEDYNEESVKSLLEGILAENREARELKENRETREFEERKLIRAFELERMKLANSTDTISVASTDLEGLGVNRRVNLRDLVPKFDAKNVDINLFFEIFERQAKKEKVAEDRWVSHLIHSFTSSHSFTSDRNCGDSSERTFREKRRLPPHKTSTLGPVPTHTDSP